MAENTKYRYNFQDRGKEKVYQSETPYSASTHVLSQNKESKEDSPTAGHKDSSYNKKTGNVTISHNREEGGVKIKGYKTIPATKEHEEDLKNASVSPLVESLLAKATKEKKKSSEFRVDTKEVDTPKQYRTSTQYSGEEPSTHSVGFPKVGDNQSIRDKKYKYNPKEQTLEVENRIGHYGRENKKYDTAGSGRKIPDLINASKEVELEKTKATKMNRAFQNFARSEDKKIAREEDKKHTIPRTRVLEGGGEVKNISDRVIRVRPRSGEAMQLSISDQCDDILSKYMGTGRYSGSGENDPVVTKREGYTVRERPLPGQTKASIKAGHIKDQKEESPKKLEPHEKEKSKIRDEGYKLGQKNPASQYSPPAPPEKKYSGNWREFFKRSFEAACDAIMNKGKGSETPSWMEDEDSYNSVMSGGGKKRQTHSVKEDDSSYNHEYDSHSETPRIKTYDEKQEYNSWREKIAKLGAAKSIEVSCDVIMEKGKTFKEIDAEESPRKEKKIKAIERAKDKASYTNRFGTKFDSPPKQAMTLSNTEDTMNLRKTVDDLLEKCNSHVITGETEEGLKKKKKEAPKADGHTLGKNPPAAAEDMEMVKVDTEGAFKSKDYEDFQPSKKEQDKLMGKMEKESGVKYPTAKEIEKRQATKSLDERTVDLHKTQLPGLNKPAVKSTDKVKTTEDVVRTEKPKNLIRSVVDELMQKSLGDIVNRGTNERRGQAYKNDPDAGIEREKERKMDAEEKRRMDAMPKYEASSKSMDDRTAEQYIKKSVHLFKDLAQPEGKPVELFHVPDETYKSQKAVLNKWQTGNPSSIGGNRIMNTTKDMASTGHTSLQKEDEDISHEEMKGRKRMDVMDVKAEKKASRKEYSGDDGAED